MIAGTVASLLLAGTCLGPIRARASAPGVPVAAAPAAAAAGAPADTAAGDFEAALHKIQLSGILDWELRWMGRRDPAVAGSAGDLAGALAGGGSGMPSGSASESRPLPCSGRRGAQNPARFLRARARSPSGPVRPHARDCSGARARRLEPWSGEDAENARELGLRSPCY